MRGFIGIDFPPDVKKGIVEIQKVIRGCSLKGRWKYIDNFHLTLKFMGEISERQVDSIFESMEGRINSLHDFTLTTGDIGYFKGQECFRVVYLKLINNGGYLDRLFEIAEDCCFLSGIERDKRRFTPHITIAQDVVLKKDFEYIKDEVKAISGIRIPVKEISIIKSEQIESKRVYTTVRNIRLSSPNARNM